MDKGDWLILIIDSGKTLSPVQLQKSLFLVGKELAIENESDFYCFEPYNYGPFDSEIYKDATILEKEELVKIENPFERSHRYYCITEAGSKKATEIRSNLGEEQYIKVSNIVSLVKSLSFPSLVKMIYDRYPEFKVNSVFQN